mmetsp:Transcript_23242/g.33197  ORF Transcript_23242/g.33197 Transcript_23242/m.33197 type:complete len:278 (-) Transcript_23242:72-905(-)
MSLRATAVQLNASSGQDVLLGTNADGTLVSWMERNWPFWSWAIFLFGSGILFAKRHKRDEHWYGWLVLVAYCLHQSEEHAYDVRGWRYSFVPSFNEGPLSELFRETCQEFLALSNVSLDDGGVISCPLDPKITLWVNTILIWGGFGGCMVFATFWPSRFLLSGSLNWGTAVVNGFFGHILPAILTKSYNPGVVQSVCMVPLGIKLIVASGRPGLCLLNGLISHVALILGVNIVFRLRTNEIITMSVMMLLAGIIVPLGIANRISTHSSSKGSSAKNQ